MARRRASFNAGRGFAAPTRRPVVQPRISTSPPPGSYDPGIDAQVGQANRGLSDLLSDYIRDWGEPGTALGGRSGEDLALGKQGVERSYGRNMTDLLTTRARAGEDFGQSRARAGEDYGQSITGLKRNFAQQGAAQGQSARAAGVQRGGALAQALAKRTANEAIARQPIDQGFARFGQDSARSESRFNADSAQSESRLGEDRGLALGGLDRGFLRGADDANITLGRAGRENSQFGLDATAQRFYQADLPLPLPDDAGGARDPRAPGNPRTARGLGFRGARRRFYAGRGYAAP